MERRIGVNLARISQSAMMDEKTSFRRKREGRAVKTIVGGVVLTVEWGAPLGVSCRWR